MEATEFPSGSRQQLNVATAKCRAAVGWKFSGERHFALPPAWVHFMVCFISELEENSNFASHFLILPYLKPNTGWFSKSFRSFPFYRAKRKLQSFSFDQLRNSQHFALNYVLSNLYDLYRLTCIFNICTDNFLIVCRARYCSILTRAVNQNL